MKVEVKEGSYIVINSDEIVHVSQTDESGVPTKFHYDGDVVYSTNEDVIRQFSHNLISEDGQAVRGLMASIEACILSLDEAVECVYELGIGEPFEELEEGKYIDYVINTTLKLLTNKYKSK